MEFAKSSYALERLHAAAEGMAHVLHETLCEHGPKLPVEIRKKISEQLVLAGVVIKPEDVRWEFLQRDAL